MLRSYTPADALTIGNASCGTIAIFLCLDYMAFGDHRRIWIAILLLPLALVCDVLDGYVARLNRTRPSLLGADLDSLADVISFGVAPAVLGYTLGLRATDCTVIDVRGDFVGCKAQSQDVRIGRPSYDGWYNLRLISRIERLPKP